MGALTILDDPGTWSSYIPCGHVHLVCAFETAGTEVVQGHLCNVENVLVTRPDGKTIESKVWEAQDLKGVLVKIESHLGDITLSAFYRDISLETPDQGLFTIPKKCTAIEEMGQVAEEKILN